MAFRVSMLVGFSARAEVGHRAGSRLQGTARSIFRYLLYEQAARTRAQIRDDLRGLDDEAMSKTTFQRELAKLRKFLDLVGARPSGESTTDALQENSEGIVVNLDSGQVDLWQFRASAEAARFAKDDRAQADLYLEAETIWLKSLEAARREDRRDPHIRPSKLGVVYFQNIQRILLEQRRDVRHGWAEAMFRLGKCAHSLPQIKDWLGDDRNNRNLWIDFVVAEREVKESEDEIRRELRECPFEDLKSTLITDVGTDLAHTRRKAPDAEIEEREQAHVGYVVSVEVDAERVTGLIAGKHLPIGASQADIVRVRVKLYSDLSGIDTRTSHILLHSGARLLIRQDAPLEVAVSATGIGPTYTAERWGPPPDYYMRDAWLAEKENQTFEGADAGIPLEEVERVNYTFCIDPDLVLDHEVGPYIGALVSFFDGAPSDTHAPLWDDEQSVGRRLVRRASRLGVLEEVLPLARQHVRFARAIVLETEGVDDSTRAVLATELFGPYSLLNDYWREQLAERLRVPNRAFYRDQGSEAADGKDGSYFLAGCGCGNRVALMPGTDDESAGEPSSALVELCDELAAIGFRDEPVAKPIFALRDHTDVFVPISDPLSPQDREARQERARELMTACLDATQARPKIVMRTAKPSEANWFRLGFLLYDIATRLLTMDEATNGGKVGLEILVEELQAASRKVHLSSPIRSRLERFCALQDFRTNWDLANSVAMRIHAVLNQ